MLLTSSIAGVPHPAEKRIAPLDSAALRCDVVRDFGRLEELAPAWKHLWESDPTAEIFLSFDWVRAWWRAFGNHCRLMTPIVFEGDELVGVLPLVFRGSRLQFLGAPESDYADILCHDDRAASVLELSLASLQEEPEWKSLELESLSESSRIVRYRLRVAPRLRRRIQVLQSGTAYAILVNSDGLFRALADKQHLRRRQNRLQKSGNVVFRHVESVEEALHQLDLFCISQHRRRALHGKPSSVDQPEFRELLRNLIRQFDLTRELRFGLLELDHRPIAWHISFESHGKFLFYQQTFDVDAWDLAPGEALLRYMLLYAQSRGLREFDFTSGDEPFKERFANHERRLYSLYMDRLGLAGRLRSGLRRAKSAVRPTALRIRSGIKSQKASFESFRKLRGWLLSAKAALTTSGEPLLLALLKKSARFLWDKSETDLFVAPPTPSLVPWRDGHSQNSRVAPASLGDLVDFAERYPSVISPTDVLALRERFRRGDVALCEFRSEEPIQIAWCSCDPGGASAGDQTRPAVLGTERGLIWYELWQARGPSRAPSPRLLLDSFLAEASAKRLAAKVLCPEQAQDLQSALVMRGFSCTRHMVSVRVFRRVVWQGGSPSAA